MELAMNRYDLYRRRQRRYALLRFVIAWAAILLGCLLALFGFWSFMVLLLGLAR